MTNFLIVLDVILGVILLGFLGFWAYNRIQAKRLGGELTNEEFKAGMRKASRRWGRLSSLLTEIPAVRI